DAADLPVVVTGIFSGTIDQQLLFLVDQIGAMVLAHFDVGNELNRVRGASVFAKSAKNTAREVDAEKLGIAASVFVFGRLQRDAIYRAYRGNFSRCIFCG